MKKSLVVFGSCIVLLLVILGLVLIVKTCTYPFISHQNAYEYKVTEVPVSPEAIQRFAGGLRFATVNDADYMKTDFTPFKQFIEYLEKTYPKVHEQMKKEIINGYGLVLHWKGKSQELKPLLFLSHYDVVPAETKDKSDAPVAFRLDDKALPAIDSYQTQWDFPPFAGTVANGRIYGRGALDMKCMLFALMEASETLITEGFVPDQDIYFAFGNDEETSGLNGALKIADHFKKQGLQFDAVFDEGGLIDTSGLGKVERPVALIGVAEKGFLTLRLRVAGTGGHSSMPPAKSSLVMAAEIIERLNQQQMPSRIIEPIEAFLTNIGGEMDFTSRMAIANRWLLESALIKSLSGVATSNALVRTTTAITMAQGSDAPNVLATIAEVTINFRILQGDTVDGVINHVKKICEGYKVEMEVLSSREPSSISPIDTKGFRGIKNTLLKFFPDIHVTSYVTIGGTDAYKYQIVSNNIYRFMPLFLNQFEQQLFHNDNEHIKIGNYMITIEYFKELMKNYQQN